MDSSHKGTIMKRFVLVSLLSPDRLLSKHFNYWWFNKPWRSCDVMLMAAVMYRPGPQFNIKMTSYQYRKSHCGDKTILRPSYLHNGISYTGKMSSLYWIRAQEEVWVDVITWKCFPRHWSFLRGIHWWFPSQRASDVESFSMPCRRNGALCKVLCHSSRFICRAIWELLEGGHHVCVNWMFMIYLLKYQLFDGNIFLWRNMYLYQLFVLSDRIPLRSCWLFL